MCMHLVLDQFDAHFNASGKAELLQSDHKSAQTQTAAASSNIKEESRILWHG